MLASLEVRDFRCLHEARIDFHPSSTLIFGPNASGKTSILEALHALGRGRSFRAPRLTAAIRNGTPAWQLVGTLTTAGGRQRILGMETSHTGTAIRIDGQPGGVMDLAQAFPVSVIDPEVHRLIEEGPGHRRRFVDWGVFHVEPTFMPAWRRYQRALRQRNAALKARSSAPLTRSWDSELTESGRVVDHLRRSYIERLSSHFQAVGAALLGIEVSATYESGWRRDATLEEALAGAWSHDSRTGTTTVGPHRAELVVRVDGHLAKTFVSRGQQKLLSVALILAQLRLNESSGSPPGCLLMDDPAAELDVDNLGKFFEQVAQTRVQIVATALEVIGIEGYLPGRKFHVEQGKVTQLL